MREQKDGTASIIIYRDISLPFSSEHQETDPNLKPNPDPDHHLNAPLLVQVLRYKIHEVVYLPRGCLHGPPHEPPMLDKR